MQIITENYQSGFSANMCEDLVDLMDAIGGQKVAFQFSFSEEWRCDPELSARIELLPPYSEIVREAGKRLRLQEFERQQTVVGRVTKLETDSDPSNLFDSGDREIAIQWNSKDFGDIRVRVMLPAEQYLVANEAHGRGQLVSVSGTIDRQGRSWFLLDPFDFVVLPQLGKTL